MRTDGILLITQYAINQRYFLLQPPLQIRYQRLTGPGAAGLPAPQYSKSIRNSKSRNVYKENHGPASGSPRP